MTEYKRHKYMKNVVYGCSMWSDNISAKHKLEVTILKKKRTKERQQ